MNYMKLTGHRRKVAQDAGGVLVARGYFLIFSLGRPEFMINCACP